MDNFKIKGEDSRALLPEHLELFMPGGKLHPFVQLVKKHDELELCFRGNGKPERVSIYFNNNQVFKIEVTGAIYVSFNHARYREDWRKYLGWLKEYDFNTLNPEDYLKKGKASIGEIKRPKKEEPLSEDEVEDLYTRIIYPIFKQYYNVCGVKDTIDYFREALKNNGINDNEEKDNSNGEDENKKSNSIKRTPHKPIEKIEQQRLYRKIKEKKSGYFFYDLEYLQKGHKNNNQPDMQAIKFDANGKPEKIVFVEVKCTKAALKGKGSGLAAHVKDMESEIGHQKNMDARRKEAYQILTQYAKLGLCGLDENIEFQYDDFKNLEYEILIVLTGEAKELWKRDDSIRMIRDRAEPVQASYDDTEMYVIKRL